MGSSTECPRGRAGKPVRFVIGIFLLGLPCVLAAACIATPAAVHLSPGVPVVVATTAPPAVRRAAVDLQRDLAAVLGQASPILDSCPADVPCSDVLASDPAEGKPEAHFARVEGGVKGPPRVVLGGSDMRGVIYSIYTFSEKVLGVPPLWFFADWKPARLDGIDLPADFAITCDAPHVRWRAWFLDNQDMDMLAPWEARAPEERFDRVLETMLRLKLNTIDLDSMVDFPKESIALRHARRARDRGLAITTTHTSPMATDWRQWNPYWRLVRHRDPPPLRLPALREMEEFWGYFIDLCRREKFEMIWETGFRSASDRGFFRTFGDAPEDDAGRAAIIGEMIRRQITLLRAKYGGEPLEMRSVLYNESSDYFAAGLLTLPRDPDLIWNFVAARRDHFPAPDILSGRIPADQPFGYYLNLQFNSTGAHIAPAEGPWKIARNYEMVAAASPLPMSLWVVNAGNVREVLCELSMHAAQAWTPEGWDTDRSLEEWCRTYFGVEHAAKAAGIIRAHYSCHWMQRAPDLSDFSRQYLFHDLRVARACDDLLAGWNKPGTPLSDRNMGYFRIEPSVEGTDDQLVALDRGVQRSVGKFSHVIRDARTLGPLLNARGRRLWHDHVLVSAGAVAAGERALLALLRGHREHADASARVQSLRQADAALAEMRAWLDSADAPPFDGWSRSEHVWGIDAKRKRIRELLAAP